MESMKRGMTLCVLVLVAALLPSVEGTARTITVPQVMSRSERLAGPGTIALDFPATHAALSWAGGDGTRFRYRAIAEDGALGEWNIAREAHDLERDGRHSTGVLGLGRAAALEWRPLGHKGPTDVEIFYMNTDDGPPITRTIEQRAQLDPGDPAIVSRAAWGADESLKSTSGGCDRDFFPVQQLFVHHTVDSDPGPDYAATMRAIYTYHTEGRGWCDVGYNFVIAPDGTIFEGRWARPYSDWEIHSSEDRSGNAVAGAHVGGYNSGSVGISMMGTFTKASWSTEARASLVRMLAWEADRHDLDPLATHVYDNPSTGAKKTLPYIAGHRDAGSTECPGDAAYKALPSLRNDVALAIGSGRSTSHLSLVVDSSKVDNGEDVHLSGQLTSDGAALDLQTVILYFKTGTGPWQELSRFQTTTEGSFSYDHVPERTTRYEVAFEGDETAWGSASGRRTVRLKPVLKIEAEGGRKDAQGVEHFEEPGSVVVSGTVDPKASSRLNLKVFRVADDASEKLVRTKELRADAGEFTGSYSLRRPGVTYRVVIWHPASRSLAAARSNSVFVVLDD